jgi:predicted permease
VNDVRYALRLLRRDPGYAAVAIATIALGIGATTTLFSVAYGLLLKPLPWADAGRIVRVAEARGGHQPRLTGQMSNGAYFAWQDHHDTIEALGAYETGVNNATALRGSGAEPVRIRVTGMTPTAFTVLREQPLRGRLFTDDEVPAAGVTGVNTPRPILIGYALWRDWFGGRDDALGTVLRVNDVPHTIVGVMPATFAFPDPETQAWAPLPIPQAVANGWPNARSIMLFGALARLKPGISPEQAAAQATSMARQAPDPGFAAVAMFGSDAPSEITVTPLAKAMTAEVRPAILLLLAAVALLLATAVANVGALQLARATTRQREIAVRAALGASRGVLLRQLFVESVAIAGFGAIAGLALAFGLDRILPSILPSDFPRAADIAIGLPVLTFATLLSVVAGLGACLMPASLTRRIDVTTALAEESAGSAVGVWRSRSGRLRTLVMSAQVAVACVLLVGAALLGRSFIALMHADRGYDPTNVLTARLDLPQSTNGATRARVADAVIGRMHGVPGVLNAAAGNALPFTSLGTALGTKLPSPVNPAVNVQVHANLRMVSPEYFAAMRLSLFKGRLLTDGDGVSSPAIVVSRSFAEQYLGADPIGKQVPIGFTKELRIEWQVVGVVGDMRQGAITDPQVPELFVTYRQVADAWRQSSIYFVIRMAGEPSSQIGALRAAVREQDPTMALDSIMTMQERLATSLAKPRLYALLLGGFAIAALAIAAVGLFGVLSYSVAQRTREIGIRTALGAQVHDIVTLVFKHAIVIALAGVVLGLWSAYVLARYLSSFLYGVLPSDVLSYILVAGVVVAIAAIACVVPARRAARVDPLIALKAD